VTATRSNDVTRLPIRTAPGWKSRDGADASQRRSGDPWQDADGIDMVIGPFLELVPDEQVVHPRRI